MDLRCIHQAAQVAGHEGLGRAGGQQVQRMAQATTRRLVGGTAKIS